MAKSPKALYLADTESGKVTYDESQHKVITKLDDIYHQLLAEPDRRSVSILDKLVGKRRPYWEPIRGLYIWGSVGRGKTYLVNQFYNILPTQYKVRLHFHAFMQNTHEKLADFKLESDPLRRVAEAWAARVRVICLDELHVADITDAMILANLLEGLFEKGVTMVTTSNDTPDDLYRGGLQRDRFLPAISLIKRHLEVCELIGNSDYRLRVLEKAPVYYQCHAGERYSELEASFKALSNSEALSEPYVVINSRRIPVQMRADGLIWLTFDALCNGTRSVADYIELARLNNTIFVSDIPIMGNDDNDAARRFINFIDEIYDRNVNLIVSAQEKPENLYCGSRLQKSFLRTSSRLEEMQSHEYLALPHKLD